MLWRQLLPAPRVYTLRQWRGLSERYLPVLKGPNTSVGPQAARIIAVGRQQERMSSDEAKKAQEAAADKGAAGASSEPTIFARIINKEIPANIIHEDEKVSHHR